MRPLKLTFAIGISLLLLLVLSSPVLGLTGRLVTANRLGLAGPVACKLCKRVCSSRTWIRNKAMNWLKIFHYNYSNDFAYLYEKALNLPSIHRDWHKPKSEVIHWQKWTVGHEVLLTVISHLQNNSRVNSQICYILISGLSIQSGKLGFDTQHFLATATEHRT